MVIFGARPVLRPCGAWGGQKDQPLPTAGPSQSCETSLRGPIIASDDNRSRNLPAAAGHRPNETSSLLLVPRLRQTPATIKPILEFSFLFNASAADDQEASIRSEPSAGEIELGPSVARRFLNSLPNFLFGHNSGLSTPEHPSAKPTPPGHRALTRPDRGADGSPRSETAPRRSFYRDLGTQQAWTSVHASVSGSARRIYMLPPASATTTRPARPIFQETRQPVTDFYSFKFNHLPKKYPRKLDTTCYTAIRTGKDIDHRTNTTDSRDSFELLSVLWSSPADGF